MKKSIFILFFVCLCTAIFIFNRHENEYRKNVRYLSIIFGSKFPPTVKIKKTDILEVYLLPRPEIGGQSDFWIECTWDEIVTIIKNKKRTRTYAYDYGDGLTSQFNANDIPKRMEIIKTIDLKSGNDYGDGITSQSTDSRIPKRMEITKTTYAMYGNIADRVYVDITVLQKKLVSAHIYMDFDIRKWYE